MDSSLPVLILCAISMVFCWLPLAVIVAICLILFMPNWRYNWDLIFDAKGRRKRIEMERQSKKDFVDEITEDI